MYFVTYTTPKGFRRHIHPKTLEDAHKKMNEQFLAKLPAEARDEHDTIIGTVSESLLDPGKWTFLFLHPDRVTLLVGWTHHPQAVEFEKSILQHHE